jgi:hypothetical protein
MGKMSRYESGLLFVYPAARGRQRLRAVATGNPRFVQRPEQPTTRLASAGEKQCPTNEAVQTARLRMASSGSNPGCCHGCAADKTYCHSIASLRRAWKRRSNPANRPPAPLSIKPRELPETIASLDRLQLNAWLFKSGELLSHAFPPAGPDLPMVRFPEFLPSFPQPTSV